MRRFDWRQKGLRDSSRRHPSPLCSGDGSSVFGPFEWKSSACGSPVAYHIGGRLPHAEDFHSKDPKTEDPSPEHKGEG